MRMTEIYYYNFSVKKSPKCNILNGGEIYMNLILQFAFDQGIFRYIPYMSLAT